MPANSSYPNASTLSGAAAQHHLDAEYPAMFDGGENVGVMDIEEERELEGCEPAYLTLANEEAAEEAKAAADYRKRVQTLAEALESTRLSEDEPLLHEAPCHGTPVRGTALGEAIARSSGDPQYVADFGFSPKRPRGRNKGGPSPSSSHSKFKALQRLRVQKYRYVAKELAVPENELPKPDLRFSKEMELWEKGLESYCGSVDLREEQEL
jgi:hypothetical protein